MLLSQQHAQLAPVLLEQPQSHAAPHHQLALQRRLPPKRNGVPWLLENQLAGEIYTYVTPPDINGVANVERAWADLEELAAPGSAGKDSLRFERRLIFVDITPDKCDTQLQKRYVGHVYVHLPLSASSSLRTFPIYHTDSVCKCLKDHTILIRQLIYK